MYKSGDKFSRYRINGYTILSSGYVVKFELCMDYEKKGKCKYGDKCRKAHENDDLFYLKECFNGNKCINKKCKYHQGKCPLVYRCPYKNCKFEHPKGWDYKYNIKICSDYINGYCKYKVCEFEHEDPPSYYEK